MNNFSAISTTAHIPTNNSHQASDANTFALTAAGQVSDMIQATQAGQAHNGAAPLVASPPSPLFGSAHDVFNRANVISITHPHRASLTFENNLSDYRNTLIMYRLDQDGTIRDTRLLFPDAVADGLGGALLPGRSRLDFDLEAGDQIGFAILPNAVRNSISRALLERADGHFALVNALGEPANLFNEHPGGMNLVHVDPHGAMNPINGEYGNKLFHTTGNQGQGLQTNVDGHDHADHLIDAGRGKILIGMDDRYAPESARRNGLILSLDIGAANAQALTNFALDRPRSFRDIAGADWRAGVDEIISAARLFDTDGDGRLNDQEWAEFAPLLNLGPEDHRHLLGATGRGDIEALAFLLRAGDADGDGKLDAAEILEFRRRLNGDDPTVIQSFREAAGFDQRLSRSEFTATLNAHDRDGNGLSQEEWNRFAPVLGLVPADRAMFLDKTGAFDRAKFETLFDLADRDGDGHLDPQEALNLRRIAVAQFQQPDFPHLPMQTLDEIDACPDA
ncbi:MAG: hypothetical protein ACXIVE_04110 [Salinarimonas sp.]